MPSSPAGTTCRPTATCATAAATAFAATAASSPTASTLTLAPHRAHWQPLDYNALHGGIQRWFVPLAQEMVNSPAWMALLLGLARTASALKGEQPWFIEAHPFRIDTSDGIGRPTPEGAHRDGVDLVAVLFVGRHGVKGGESRVFDAAGPAGQRFTMTEPWTTLLLDDARVIHETTPIQPHGGGRTRLARYLGHHLAKRRIPGPLSHIRRIPNGRAKSVAISPSTAAPKRRPS